MDSTFFEMHNIHRRSDPVAAVKMGLLESRNKKKIIEGRNHG